MSYLSMTDYDSASEEVKREYDDQIAKMEIAIQYIGNPDFREKLNEFVFESNYHK